MSRNLRQVGLVAGLIATLSLVLGLMITMPGCSESPLFAHEQELKGQAEAESEVMMMPEVSVTGTPILPVLPEVRVTARRLTAEHGLAPLSSAGRVNSGQDDVGPMQVFD